MTSFFVFAISKAVESIQHGETNMIESGSCCALVALEIAKTKNASAHFLIIGPTITWDSCWYSPPYKIILIDVCLRI